MAKDLKVREATRKLGISIDGLYRLIYSNRLPARKDAEGRWLIPAEAVEARLEAREGRNRAAAEEAVA